MLKKTIETLVRHAPPSVVKLLARAINRVPRAVNFAHFVADRGSIPRNEGKVKISSSPPLFLSDDGSRIVKISYFIGADAYEPGEARVWQKLCSMSDNILEIGGNIGFFSVLGASATRGRYRVLEPHPRNAESLRRNIEQNQLRNVEVIQAAVIGQRNHGKITLHVPIQETGRLSTGAYIEGAEGIDRPATEAFEVATLSGGELADDLDLLKMDVEGAEFQILESMTNGLAASLPIIVLEVRRRTPQLRDWIWNFAAKNRYQLYALNNRMEQIALDEIREVVLQERFSTRDIIMVPTNRYTIVRELREANGKPVSVMPSARML